MSKQALRLPLIKWFYFADFIRLLLLLYFGNACNYFFCSQFSCQLYWLWHRLHHGQSSMVSSGRWKDPWKQSCRFESRNGQYVFLWYELLLSSTGWIHFLPTIWLFCCFYWKSNRCWSPHIWLWPSQLLLISLGDQVTLMNFLVLTCILLSLQGQNILVLLFAFFHSWCHWWAWKCHVYNTMQVLYLVQYCWNVHRIHLYCQAQLKQVSLTQLS